MTREVDEPFRPRARLLQLLGDQLIGSPRLAVLELVKNAYDANATEVQIVLDDIDDDKDARIVVTDDGDGMDFPTVRDVWLVPGHDHRAVQRREGRRTRLGRLPLGEKGVGRFAVHKLGDQVTLVTRSAGGPEVFLSLDWAELAEHSFLSDALVHVQTREPLVFSGNRTGTQITVSALRGEPWTKRQVGWLNRQVLSIASPFSERADKFGVVLKVTGHDDWLDSLQDPAAILRFAPWKFEFEVAGGQIEYSYEFRGVSGISAVPRATDFGPKALESATSGLPLSPDVQAHIGPVRGVIYAFDRDSFVLKQLGHAALIRAYLNENGGLRVYRDGIRVYNYGEPQEDWLGLDLRRVNTPAERVSNSILLGAIDLDLEASDGLREKTNREGFIEDDAYGRLRDIVLSSIALFEVERNMDKRAIRRAIAKPSKRPDSDLQVPLEKIKAIAQKQGIADQIDPLVADTLERFEKFKATMLRSNLSGMALVVVFHELEQGIRQLVRDGEAGANPLTIAEQARIISRLLDGFGDILRKGEVKKNSIQMLLKRVVQLNAVRLSHHKVEVISPLIEEEQMDSSATFSFGLLLGALNNLLDNSFYWMSQAHEDGRSSNAIFLGFDPDYQDGPAIIVADNGPGFVDPPEDLTDAFFTRRPNGMGVGLYYVSLAAELSGGRVAFPDRSQLDLPREITGAVVALVLPREKVG